MIRDEELQVQTHVNMKDSKLGESNDLIKDTSFILGTDLSKVSNSNYKSNHNAKPLNEIDLNSNRGRGLSSIFSWNAFNGMMVDGKLQEKEIYLESDKNIKVNVEFLSNRLENVNVNFLKHKSP